MNRLRDLFLLLTLLAVPVAAWADEPAPPAEEKVSYYRDIRPIFQERCQGCHQPAKPQGGFVMTSVAAMQEGGKSGEPGIMAGDAEGSLLYFNITPDGDLPPLMPKGSDPLPKHQLELIARWIDQGGEDDTPANAAVSVDMEHPPVYAAAPVVTSLDYSPDGKLLAVSGYHEVLIHSAEGDELIARLVGLSERIESAVFSPDGARLAVTGGSPGRFGELQVWDVAKRELLLSVMVTYDTIYGASWSSDGSKIAFGCGDNSVRAVDTKTGKQVLYQGAHSDWALDTIFSSDDSHLVSVSRDMSMKLTEVATERFVDNITSITPGALKGGLMAVDRHPARDELLCGGSDGVPKIYRMYRTQDRKIGDDFNLIRAFDALPGRIFDLAFSQDGERFVVGSSSDGSGEVRVYQTADGALVSKLEGQNGPVYAVAFRNDGQRVAVGGFDGKVRLFDANDGKLLKEFVPAPISPPTVAATR